MKTKKVSRAEIRSLISENIALILEEEEQKKSATEILKKIAASGHNAITNDSAAKEVLIKAVKSGGVDVSKIRKIGDMYKNMGKIIAAIVKAKKNNMSITEALKGILRDLNIQMTPSEFLVNIAFSAIPVPGGKLGLIGFNLIKGLTKFGAQKAANEIKVLVAKEQNKVSDSATGNTSSITYAAELFDTQELSFDGMNDSEEQISKLIAKGVDGPMRKKEKPASPNDQGNALTELEARINNRLIELRLI